LDRKRLNRPKKRMQRSLRSVNHLVDMRFPFHARFSHVTFKIKFTCAYYAESMPAEIQSLFSGLMLRCYRCEKITLGLLRKQTSMPRGLLWGSSTSLKRKIDPRRGKPRDVPTPLPAIICEEPKKSSIRASPCSQKLV
jgi:hypothetical protein